MDQYMIADGLAGMMLMASATLGVLLCVVAVVVEIVVAAIVLKRRPGRVLVWITVANIASALFCMWPALASVTLDYPAIDADPLEVQYTYWQTFLVQIIILFGITLVIESLLLLAANSLTKKKLELAKLMRIVLIGNVASYIVLTGIVWQLPPNDDTFELLPDTGWVDAATAGRHRVWFVDQDSERICSIELDGSDRRTELDAIVGRHEWYVEKESIYARLPKEGITLYVDGNDKWHCVRDESDQLLTADASDLIPRRPEVWGSLRQALSEIGVETTENDALPDLYFRSSESLWRTKAESDRYDVRTPVPWVVGIQDAGIRIHDKQSGNTSSFGVKSGVCVLPCRDPVILDEEGLILFRCGGWIMVMDPEGNKVGRLTRGTSLLLELDVFNSLEW